MNVYFESKNGAGRINSIKAILMTCFVLLSSCSIVPNTKPITSKDINHLLSGEALFGKMAHDIELPDDNIFEITDEMQEFLDQLIPKRSTKSAKINALINAIHNKSSLGFTYDSKKTLSAKDAFSKSTGNCLSHSILLITLTRELGFKSRFNQVEIPQTWGLQGDKTLLLYKHVNTVISSGSKNEKIIDITPEIYRSEYPQEIIPDHYGEAQYYNNLAVNFMTDGKIYEAFRYFKKALILAPKISYLWSNLGALYRRYGTLLDAEKAFLHALTLDSNNSTAISSLERLYRNMGMEEKALVYRSKIKSIRNRNPYFLHMKAKEAYTKGDYQRALNNSLLAIKKHKKDHRFYLVLSDSYSKLENFKQAKSAINDAIKLATTEKTREIYQEKLRKIQQQRTTLFNHI